MENCPHCKDLECSPIERTDEFYRQMQEAMLQNRSVAFLTGGKCPVWSGDCIKLREYQEKLQKQR